MSIERDQRGVPTDPKHKAAWHLLELWSEYEPPFPDDKGVLHFEHYTSGGRQDAAKYLEELGFGVDQGWTFMLNTAGVELFKCGLAGGGFGAVVGWETVYKDPKESHGGL